MPKADRAAPAASIPQARRHLAAAANPVIFLVNLPVAGGMTLPTADMGVFLGKEIFPAVDEIIVPAVGNGHITRIVAARGRARAKSVTGQVARAGARVPTVDPHPTRLGIWPNRTCKNCRALPTSALPKTYQLPSP